MGEDFGRLLKALQDTEKKLYDVGFMIAYKIRERGTVVYLMITLYRLEEQDEDIITKFFECKSSWDVAKVYDFLSEICELCHEAYQRELNALFNEPV